MASSTRLDKASNDRSLRFYRDVLGLERLHYGLWEEDDELTLEALKRAQLRYEDALIDQVPERSSRVLDVGCGTGEMCLSLKRRGFAVEGLSPDRNQQKVFGDKVQAPFHHCRFEHFKPEHAAYDCIIMSESAQYIPMERLFDQAARALKSGSALIVCDYFVVDHEAGILSKSGHCLSGFLKASERAGFELISRRDVTKEAAKTLDMGKLLAERMLLGFQIMSERFRLRNPRCFAALRWLARKKIAKALAQMELLDAKRFSAAKRYELLVFRKNESAARVEAMLPLAQAV